MKLETAVKKASALLEAFGIRLQARSLYAWAYAGLIPGPIRGRRSADWSAWAVAEAVAAAFLMHRAGWTVDRVKEWRTFWGPILETHGSINWALDALTEQTPPFDYDGFDDGLFYLFCALKAAAEKPWPLDRAATLEVYETGFSTNVTAKPEVLKIEAKNPPAPEREDKYVFPRERNVLNFVALPSRL